MPSFNKVILMGNMTRDPELRYTPKGTAVVKIGLAVNRTWRTETGEQKEECTFVDTTFFGKSAETISKHLGKGDPIFVEGRLHLDTWEEKETKQKRSKIVVIGEEFRFLGQRKEGGEQRSEGGSQKPAGKPKIKDEDVPF